MLLEGLEFYVVRWNLVLLWEMSMILCEIMVQPEDLMILLQVLTVSLSLGTAPEHLGVIFNDYLVQPHN